MRKTVYACITDWQYEVCEAPDLEGNMPFYSSVEELKLLRSCWKQCGIVRLEISEAGMVEPPLFFGGDDEADDQAR